MQFKVPQFIDIEDKVFGPLTFKQFAYLAGGAGFVYISLKLLPIYLGLIIAPIFGALGLALAFMRYNEKPFIHVLESFIKYNMRSRLYLWRKQDAPKIEQVIQKQNPEREKLTMSKLQTLSWSLDVISPEKSKK